MNTLIGFILVLGVLILVHEWGHFIVARLFGVRVDVFSVGFGPRLFGWKRGATDYRVSAIPLGGYVRMAGQDLSEIDSGDSKPTGAPDELMSKKRWQRALISFAGPAVNLIFPIVLLTGLFASVGVPYSAYLDKPVQIVALPSNATGAARPFQVGDKILSVNGTQNPTWEQVLKALKQAGTAKVVMEVQNGDLKRTVDLPITQDLQTDRLFGYVPLPPVIDEVAPGMPADRGGLKDGDVILAIDDQKIAFWGQFVDRVRASGGKPVKLEIQRKGQTIQLQVAPQPAVTESGETIYQVGVVVRDPISYHRVPFTSGVVSAAVTTGDKVRETIDILGKLVSRRVSVKQLQSVVGISRAAGEAVQRGPLAVISLMVVLSINLGILNLLPIPILDGGNILLLAMEGIRRRDFSMSFKERFVQVGLVFLLVLFAYVMYNDVKRLLPFHS